MKKRIVSFQRKSIGVLVYFIFLLLDTLTIFAYSIDIFVEFGDVMRI